MEKIKLKGFKFEVKNIQKKATSVNFWTNSYVLEIANGTEIQRKNLVQRVYFIPKKNILVAKRKKFGVFS